MQPYDVIVVGAGPAGSATAYFLARAGVRVLLLDKAAFPRDKTCGDCLSPRAQHMLDQMGLTSSLAVAAHAAHEMHLYAPNGQCARTAISGGDSMPNRTLVLPRRQFDHLVQQRALDAGAVFRVGRVSRLHWQDNRAAGVVVNQVVDQGDQEDQEEIIPARLVVIATGAAIGLPRAAGMLPHRPTLSVAARRYYTGIDTGAGQLEIYFNDVALPGYVWLFPTGPTSANLGYWYSGQWPLSSRVALPTLLRQHPHLARRLHHAEAVGPLKSYPLRTDFLRAQKLWPGVVAVGEAAGLVNPFTGEGIDYALESGQLAAQTIAAALRTADQPTPAHLRPYERQLQARFGPLFALMHAAQRLYCNGPMLNRIFGGTPVNQPVVDRLIQVCFGSLEPQRAFTPDTLWRLLTTPVPRSPHPDAIRGA